MSRFLLAVLHSVPAFFCIALFLWVSCVLMAKRDQSRKYEASKDSGEWGLVAKICGFALVFTVFVGASFLMWQEVVNWLLTELGYVIPDYSARSNCNGCRSSSPGDYRLGLALGSLIGIGMGALIAYRLQRNKSSFLHLDLD